MMCLKRLFFLGLILLSFWIADAQVLYLPGMITTLDGEQISCEIKDVKGKNAPTAVYYRLSSRSATQALSLHEVHSWSIDDGGVYRRIVTDRDRSGVDINLLDDSPQPLWIRDTIIVEQIIDGPISLYRYGSPLQDFLYLEVDASNPMPLTYKRYYSQSNRVNYNRGYRSELLKVIADAGFSPRDVETLEYTVHDVSRLLRKYYHATEQPYVDYSLRRGKVEWNFALQGRVNFSSLYVTEADPDLFAPRLTLDFPTSTSIGYGLEIESILPYGNRKLSLLMSLSYLSLDSEIRYDSLRFSAEPVTARLHYSALNLSFGGRYRMYLSQDLCLHVDAGLNGAIIIDSDYGFFDDLDRSILGNTPMTDNGGAVFSMGMQFRDRYGLAVQYIMPRDTFRETRFIWSELSTLSLVMSFIL